MTYRLIWEDHGVLVHCTGVLDKRTIQAVNHDLFRSPRFDRAWYQIIDLRDIEAIACSRADMADFGMLENAAVRFTKAMRMRVALVVDGQEDPDNPLLAYTRSLDNNAAVGRLFDRLETARAWAEDRDDTV